MEEDKNTTIETFLTALTNILTENGIDDTLDLLSNNKAKFMCDNRPVIIGINADERFIFYTAYKYENGLERKTIRSTPYCTVDENEFKSIIEEILKESHSEKPTPKLSDTHHGNTFQPVLIANKSTINNSRLYNNFNEDFYFSSKLGRCGNKTGYLAYNSKDEKVGVVFMTSDKRTPAYGNCELTFYKEYHNRYGQYHRIKSNGGYIKWETLCSYFKSHKRYNCHID